MSIKTITGVTGTLACPAQVRSKLSADGLHTVPTVHILLENIKGMSAKQVVIDFECNSFDAASKVADDLLKGRCICFDAPLADACISFQSLRQFQIL